MLSEVDKYLFDVNGYLVIDGIISDQLLGELNDAFDQARDRMGTTDRWLSRGTAAFDGQSQRLEFDEPFNWPRPWSLAFRRLLSNHAAVELMLELVGDGFRYDSIKGTVMVRGTEGFTLHGGAGHPDTLSYYRVFGQTIRNGLMNVAYTLHDVEPDDGGFACIPGSHKANFACPKAIGTMVAGTEHVRQIPVKAGSAIVFTEALIHGTLPWRADHERRTVFVRYSAGAVSFRNDPLPVDYADFQHELTPLQRAILEPPYYLNRPNIRALLAHEADTE